MSPDAGGAVVVEGLCSVVDGADVDPRGWVVAEEDRMLVPGSQAPYVSNERNFAFLHSLLSDGVE